MAQNYSEQCVPVPNHDDEVVKCLNKTSVQRYLDKAETNATVQLQTIKEKLKSVCSQRFSETWQRPDLLQCLEATGNQLGAQKCFIDIT